MSATYAAPPLTPATPWPDGTCRWQWHWEDVDLRCHDRAIPGGTECADHLIERVHRVHPEGGAE